MQDSVPRPFKPVVLVRQDIGDSSSLRREHQMSIRLQIEKSQIRRYWRTQHNLLIYIEQDSTFRWKSCIGKRRSTTLTYVSVIYMTNFHQTIFHMVDLLEEHSKQWFKGSIVSKFPFKLLKHWLQRNILARHVIKTQGFRSKDSACLSFNMRFKIVPVSSHLQNISQR